MKKKTAPLHNDQRFQVGFQMNFQKWAISFHCPQFTVHRYAICDEKVFLFRVEVQICSFFDYPSISWSTWKGQKWNGPNFQWKTQKSLKSDWKICSRLSFPCNWLLRTLIITLNRNLFIIFANLRCQWFQRTQRAVVKVHTIYTFHLQQHNPLIAIRRLSFCLAFLLMQCTVLFWLL